MSHDKRLRAEVIEGRVGDTLAIRVSTRDLMLLLEELDHLRDQRDQLQEVNTMLKLQLRDTEPPASACCGGCNGGGAVPEATPTEPSPPMVAPLVEEIDIDLEGDC
jgi:hypothetical protein